MSGLCKARVGVGAALCAVVVAAGCGSSSSPSGSSAAGASAAGASSSAGASAGGSGSSAAGASSGAGASSAGASGAGVAGASAGSAGSAAGGSAGTNSAGASGSAGSAGSGGAPVVDKFSFFVTSWAAIQRVSKSPDGFGGDLRFGETGAGAGLRGADKICATIAETSMPGAGAKGWRAFLSAADDGTGKQVDAITRIGAGPWYDRLGRLFGNTLTDINNTRPANANTAIINDFPNEDGVPNHQPDPTVAAVDNHDMLTGSTTMGKLYGKTATCLDWTSAVGDLDKEGKPRVGHSWPRSGGGMGDSNNWMSALTESGCKAGANLKEQGGPLQGAVTVGSGGGYGGFFCFALTP
jgi:hypothetical protein